MNINFDVGTVVKSIAGHDSGRIYLIVSFVGENFVLISDGKYHKLDKPKLKRTKHLKIIHENRFLIKEFEAKDITDKKIIDVLKNFKGS